MPTHLYFILYISHNQSYYQSCLACPPALNLFQKHPNKQNKSNHDILLQIFDKRNISITKIEQNNQEKQIKIKKMNVMSKHSTQFPLTVSSSHRNRNGKMNNMNSFKAKTKNGISRIRQQLRANYLQQQSLQIKVLQTTTCSQGKKFSFSLPKDKSQKIAMSRNKSSENKSELKNYSANAKGSQSSFNTNFYSTFTVNRMKTDRYIRNDIQKHGQIAENRQIDLSSILRGMGIRGPRQKQRQQATPQNKKLNGNLVRSKSQQKQSQNRFGFSSVNKKTIDSAVSVSKKNTKQFSKLLQIQSHFEEQKLYKRLSSYCNLSSAQPLNPGSNVAFSLVPQALQRQVQRSSIRIYKQDLQKLIINRYGKDRITSYLDIEYIQDYQSISKCIKDILKFTWEEVILFTFLIFDQNRDGLITPEDLVNLVGAKVQKTPINQMIMQDLYQIISFIKQKQSKNQSINQISDPFYQYLKDENLNLMKVRIINKKLKKYQNMSQRNRRVTYLTRRMREHLFTLRNQEEPLKSNSISIRIQNSIQSFIKFILKPQQMNNDEVINPELEGSKSPLYFSINFSTFKKIFIQKQQTKSSPLSLKQNKKIPKVFLDFLYVLGGIEVPGQKYLPLDYSILIKIAEVKQQAPKQSPLSRMRKVIDEMKIDGEISSFVYKTIKR